MRAFQQEGVRVTINTRLVSVKRNGNQLVATLGSDYAPDYREEREVDQVVVEHGTLPIDDLYRELKPLSRNDGAVDYDKLINGGAIFPARSEGNFDLVRIGDAVHARNIHAAIYDGLRYATRF